MNAEISGDYESILSGIMYAQNSSAIRMDVEHSHVK